MSLKDVKLELDEIEVQQQGLEKQGVRLEQLIRSKCESGSRTDSNYHNTYISLLYLHVALIKTSGYSFGICDYFSIETNVLVIVQGVHCIQSIRME